jgi:hypothetical protein
MCGDTTAAMLPAAVAPAVACSLISISLIRMFIIFVKKIFNYHSIKIISAKFF